MTHTHCIFGKHPHSFKASVYPNNTYTAMSRLDALLQNAPLYLRAQFSQTERPAFILCERKRIQIPFLWYTSTSYLRWLVRGAAWSPGHPWDSGLHIQSTHKDDLNSSWIQSCPPFQEAMLVPCEEELGPSHLSNQLCDAAPEHEWGQQSQASCSGDPAPTQSLAPVHVPFVPLPHSLGWRDELARK